MGAAEQRYLDSLYAGEQSEEPDPLLFNSQVRAWTCDASILLPASRATQKPDVPLQVIQQSQERPEYAQLANSQTIVSTLRPKATVNLSGSTVRTSRLKNISEDVDGDEVDAVALRRELDGVLQNLEARQQEFDEALHDANKAEELVQSMEHELRWG